MILAFVKYFADPFNMFYYIRIGYMVKNRKIEGVWQEQIVNVDIDFVELF